MINKIGKKNKKILFEKNIKQNDVAKKMKISRQAINRWCADKDYPSRKNLKILSKILDIPVSYFLETTINKSSSEIEEYRKEIDELKIQINILQKLVLSLTEKVNQIEGNTRQNDTRKVG